MKHSACLFLLSVAAWGQLGGLGSSPGSLYAPSGRLSDLTRDLKANQAGDIVTIVVSENTSAVASGATNTARKSSATSQIAALAGTLATGNPLTNLGDLSGSQQLQGTGLTSRTLTLSNTLTARVVDVTANGTLVIEADKEILVNSERQSITVRGLVRPADLTTSNTVASTRIADLQIRINGKGVVGDAIKRPFILYRILLGLLPF